MDDHRDSRLLTRVVVQNYKSIRSCDVTLGPLTFLVGPNGSGKSNFLDALRFVADALSGSLEQAARRRGGIGEILLRHSDLDHGIGFRLEFRLSQSVAGHYAFELSSLGENASVTSEECFITDTGRPGSDEFYTIIDGRLADSSLAIAPLMDSDRLYLTRVSGVPAFRPVFDALSRMSFYELSPAELRQLQTPGAPDHLARDGTNLPSVLRKLESDNPEVMERVRTYLSQVVPAIVDVRYARLGPFESVEFVQEGVPGERSTFFATNMSDGTLRSLAILVALFQNGNGHGPLLVGLEEPETALHPAAAEVLLDSLREASESRQILVTSHSPDLLDRGGVNDAEILAVVSEQGQTRIGAIEEASRSVLRDGLFGAGELLRMDQLRPEVGKPAALPDSSVLFGASPPVSA
jgi:predicted ATPase